MLELKHISNNIENITNESDYYVKIKVLLGHHNSLNDKIVYWSSCAYKNALIEVGIKQLNGAVHKITILPAHNIHNQEIQLENHSAIEKVGLPLFETQPWQKNHDEQKSSTEFYIDNYYIRQTNNFEIYAGKNSVSILLSNNEITLKVINGPIVFGFDKNNILCFIQMMRMRLNEEGFLEKINEQ